MEKNVKIATDAIVIRDGKILLGMRKGAYGAGQWGLPGGHLEYGESLVDSARRELLEETGMSANGFRLRTVTNIRKLNKHYILMGFEAIDPIGEPKLCEPDKCFEWKWFDLNALPTPLYDAHRGHFELLKSGEMFFED